MSIFTSRPVLRWAVPIAVFVAMIGGGATARTPTASAQTTSPATPTAAQLLTDLQNARNQPVSGTAVERADLGLPPLPSPSGGSSNIRSLLSGSHTLRVWYANPNQSRLALISTLGETDIIRNGPHLWVWDSQKNTATHMMLKQPGAAGQSPSATPSGSAGATPGATPSMTGTPSATASAMTPQQVSNRIIAKLSPYTNINTRGPVTVAGRRANELVLVPRDTRSLVAQVAIAVDAQRHVPLRARIFARNYANPAFETAFTQVNFAQPNPAQFTFTPPPGATVKEAKPRHAPPGAQPPTVVGKGWTSVVVAKVPPYATMSPSAPSPTTSGSQSGSPPMTGTGTASPATGSPTARPGAAHAWIQSLPRVSGPWGSGHLLRSRLFTVLFTDDGRVLSGAVPPQLLYQAAQGQAK